MNSKEIKAIFVFIFSTIFLLFLFLDTSFSTDYDPYLYRFKNSLWFLLNTNAYFFDGINFLLDKTAISNTLHIKLFFTLNYLFFSYIVFKLLKFYNNFNLSSLKLFLIFLFFFTLLFTFEYLIIRLRAGMCILLMSASFAFFLEKKYKLSIFFIIAAFFTHSIVAAVFFYASYFLLFLKINKYFELVVLVIGSIIIVYGIYYMNLNLVKNSEFSYTPLNYYRVTLYCIFPIFYILYINQKNNNFLINKSKNFSELFLKMLFYFLLAVGLFTFSNIRLYVGETILRVHGVFSFIMLFLFFDKKSLKEKIILNFYTLSINYLLFLKNYIYLLK
jgi:hypothetical protein